MRASEIRVRKEGESGDRNELYAVGRLQKEKFIKVSLAKLNNRKEDNENYD